MTLPVYRERMRVYAHHVAVLRHLIAQFGIAEPEAFDAEIEKVIAADRRKRTGTVPVTVELSEAELAGIKEITQLDDDAQAVVQAVRGYIRMMRLRELKAASGKVEFDLDWEQLEALERGESKRDPKNRWDAGPTDYPRG
ncbi:MAG: hypothetical protein K2P78_08555 [Gemmataceae bacterium]|nr:hypothetical protein [Gemmataceae bacterium]